MARWDSGPPFYELLWHTGALQTDAACLIAEDINWNTRTISYCRKKLKFRTGIKPALIRFGDEVAAILQLRPSPVRSFPICAPCALTTAPPSSSSVATA